VDSSLVGIEEESVGVVRDLCNELKPRMLLAGSKAVGLLGERIIKLYLSELPKGCNIIADSRATLRRYYAVFDLELQRWIRGSETASTWNPCASQAVPAGFEQLPTRSAEEGGCRHIQPG